MQHAQHMHPAIAIACMTAEVHYEFWGPYLGPVGIIVGLPAVCFGLFAACNQTGCVRLPGDLSWPAWPPSAQLLSTDACLAVAGWIVAQAVLHCLVPGKRVRGAELRDGVQLTYKLTGAR